MSKVRVANFSLSMDGFGAGPAQDAEHPLGENGMELHEWLFHTRTFRTMQGAEGGATGIDDNVAARGLTGIGAWILGRNMFGPVRGPWPNESWRGWWGETPPFRAPVFVLTHYARPPLEMQGGTTFTFVTAGIREAMDRAIDAARGKDVQIGGGVSTIREYLREGLIDELHLAITPVLLGRGEALFEGMNWRAMGYRCRERVAGETATHMTFTKQMAGRP